MPIVETYASLHLPTLLDRAHHALRGVDAADHSGALPNAVLDEVSEAAAAIERFCRALNIRLSEFAR